MADIEINKYLNEMRIIQSLIFKLFEAESDVEAQYNDLIKHLDNLKIREDTHYLSLFLHLLAQISTNHRQTSSFFKHVENILILYKNEIQKLANSYIFNLFKDDKKALLFLIIDWYVKSKLQYNPFFWPEIEQKEAPEEFEKKRQIGQNEDYICELIRNDSVEEFIQYTQRKNIPLDTTVINPSIFETNHYLADKQVSLIEYAAFFGSLQIYQYLRFNKVNIDDDLFMFAIHGQNPEIIHLFEDDEILQKLDEDQREKMYEESIKCHHNDIANYLRETLIDDSNNLHFSILKYYNFAFIDFDYAKLSICDLIRYDYPTFAEIILKYDDSDFLVNQKIQTEIEVQFLFIFKRYF